MKRLLCIMLILVMAFGATAPVYAEAWTSQQASIVTQSVTGILSQIANNGIGFTEWATLYADGTAPAYPGSFQNLYKRIDWALSWIVPDTMHTSSDPTMMDSLIVLTNYAMNHLPAISTIASYVSSWMTSNNGYLYQLERALSNIDPYHDTSTPYSFDYIVKSSDYYLLDDVPNVGRNGYYTWYGINNTGSVTNEYAYWQHGSPLGNIALLIKSLNNSFVCRYAFDKSAFYTHYNDQLSTWDSQGDSLQQVLFTPDSAIQGLYRYLAFIQRDVARMTYIIADPHEQAGMENANDSGVSAMYADVYDADNGGVTLSDMSDTFNTQKVAKQTFNTGVQFSTNGLFSFTDDGNWGFWSTAVKNDMDNVPQTRKSESYDSTAYDTQLEELYSIWGITDGK